MKNLKYLAILLSLALLLAACNSLPAGQAAEVPAAEVPAVEEAPPRRTARGSPR